uniref:Zinc-finger homeodomain protein 13 n=1 Tax=Noccaea caerulescens TaxID=107243 RepID=A0A1J3K3U9_NOCCA
MDERKSKNEEKCRRRNITTAICRETGDHVHYPPTRQTKSKRPHHAPSQILKSIFQVTRKARYGECRKNQASGIGTTAYDGCGEFVSATSGEDSLNCAACGCHRSFHREDTLSDGVTETVLDVLKISSDQFRRIFCSPYGEGNSRIVIDRSGGGDVVGEEEEEMGKAKRLKTKFTAEQTEKMRDYAEKLRWKVSPETREEVEKFCVEIGVNRKKFRIWMNNHKEKN